MKKLIIAVALMMTAAVQADVQWSWWLENKAAKADVAFGVASRLAEVEAFELTLLYGASPVRDGVQWSVFGINDSDAICALQMSFFFNRGKDVCVQLGSVNVDKKSALSLGFVNIADEATVQLGVLNFNKKGFLPVFPFINLSKSLFD